MTKKYSNGNNKSPSTFKKNKNTHSTSRFSRLLAFILTIVGAYALFRNWRNPNLDSGAKNLVPCADGIEQFAPSELLPSIRATLLSNACQGLAVVPPMFNEINTNAYTAEFCTRYRFQHLGKCIQLKESYNPANSLQQVVLTPTTANLKIVPEGCYSINSKKTTLVTANVSYCVAVALISNSSPEILLAHINAENILAHDEYLLRKRTESPFEPILKFIEEQGANRWQATLVSGSAANLVYIRTLLQKAGITNIKSVLEGRWAQDTTDGLFANLGNLAINKGKACLIKSPKEFIPLVPKISAYLKNKPQDMIAKDINRTLLCYRDAMFESASNFSQKCFAKAHKQQYRNAKYERVRQVRKKK